MAWLKINESENILYIYKQIILVFLWEKKEGLNISLFLNNMLKHLHITSHMVGL